MSTTSIVDSGTPRRPSLASRLMGTLATFKPFKSCFSAPRSPKSSAWQETRFKVDVEEVATLENLAPVSGKEGSRSCPDTPDPEFCTVPDLQIPYPEKAVASDVKGEMIATEEVVKLESFAPASNPDMCALFELEILEAEKPVASDVKGEMIATEEVVNLESFAPASNPDMCALFELEILEAEKPVASDLEGEIMIEKQASSASTVPTDLEDVFFVGSPAFPKLHSGLLSCGIRKSRRYRKRVRKIRRLSREN